MQEAGLLAHVHKGARELVVLGCVEVDVSLDRFCRSGLAGITGRTGREAVSWMIR